MFEIDLRFNRPLDERTRQHLNYALDDPVLGLLRWRGDDAHVVLTLCVDHTDRTEALRLAARHVAMLWPNRIPDDIEEIRAS
jgi:hypothetical protein